MKACLARTSLAAAVLTGSALMPQVAQASAFAGETLDKVADVITWIVLIIVPVIGITVFWLVHILPEKVAEKRKHPQTKAIQCLCILSLIFGGMLWPFAWIWAYSKPTLYKLAYGTDKLEDEEHDAPVKAKDEVPPVEKKAETAAADAKSAKSGKNDAGSVKAERS